MPKDILKFIETLVKVHDYHGKAKDLVDHATKIRKAAELAYGDIDSLRDLAGLDNKDVKKLIDKLNKRKAATAAAASAQFPEVPSTTAKVFWRMAAARGKYGPESKQFAKERKAYIKALTAYDIKLRERMAYCDAIINQSGRQKKVYLGLNDLMNTSYKIFEALLKLPEVKEAPHHAAVFAMYNKYLGLGPAGRDLGRAHEQLIAKARKHKAHVEKLKKENDAWINEMARSELGRMVESALDAMGF
ncbi:MAG: hypothetical protein AAF727_14530 [Pseudomonadota bacterium]